ncbi:unnamed protein product [Rhizophagus irregularis]|nr:unnamed protein product [Rhizophagus irregularis]
MRLQIYPYSISKGKKNDQDNSTQALFDYVSEQAEVLIAFTLGTFETTKGSKTSEPVIDEPETSKLSESIESISKVVDMLPKEISDKMKTDLQMYAWTIKLEDDPKEHMDMTIRERLIGEEIIHHFLEKDEIISS